MRPMFRPWLLIGLLEVTAAGVMAQETIPPPQPAQTVAATVNGQPLPEVLVQRALKRVPPVRHAQARPEIIGYLIDNMLIEQYLSKLPECAVDKKEVDAVIDQMKAELKKVDTTWEAFLKSELLTEELLRPQLTADLRWEKFASKRVTDEALNQFFMQNLSQFDNSMVHAKHILLSVEAGDPKGGEPAKAQLQLIRKQIEDTVVKGLATLPAGTDKLTAEKRRTQLLDETFSATAKEKSNCPSKTSGGDVGFFARTGSMVEPFAKVAFEIKPYQLSDVVTTQFGHHLILVVERRPGKDVKFADAKPAVREAFFDKMRENLVTQVRAKAAIAITPVKN